MLAADVPVTRELLGPDGGFRYAVGRSIASTVERIAADPAARAAAAEVGLRRARGRTWEAVFDDLFAEYRELAKVGRRLPNPSAPTSSITGQPGFVAHS